MTVDEAAEAASEAFKTFSHSTGSQRAALLRRIAAGIEGLGDPLINCVTFETALPAARVIHERARTCMQLRLFADVAEEGRWTDERLDPADPARQPPRPQIRSLHRPLGPVAVFGASNFPLAFSVAGGDTAAALAVGCPVIVKAHPAHPQTSTLIGTVIDIAVRAAGFPAGVFSLLFPAPDHSEQDLGLSLIQHPLIKAGAFTGSKTGGLALWRAAQNRREPIPFFAEMSSVNPVFLFPGALAAQPDAIATGLHASMTTGVGQFCTQPGLIFLIDNQSFLEKLSALVTDAPPGTMLSESIRKAYVKRIDERSRAPDIRILAQCHSSAQPLQVGATLFATDHSTFIHLPFLNDEIFGPSSLIVLCRTLADFERCAERLPGQLTATVWAERDELDAHTDLLWLLEQKAGRLVFNGFPTGVDVGTAVMHGGPFPATTDSRYTSVGTRSLLRFVRPVAYQGEIL